MSTTASSRRLRRALAIGLPVLALLVVAAIVGPRLYASSVNADAEATPTLGVQTSGTPSTSPPSDAGPSTGGTPSGAASSAGSTFAGRWQVGSGSFAGYRVKEVLNGADVTVTGRTSQVTGSLTVAGTDLTAATIVVDMASVTTDSGRRDDYFRGTALKTDRFPEAKFTLTEPVSLSALSSGVAASVTAKGELTIAGTTRTVTVPLQIGRTDGAVQVVGSVAITFADFGVQAPNLGFVKVEPQGSVEFSLQLRR